MLAASQREFREVFKSFRNDESHRPGGVFKHLLPSVRHGQSQQGEDG